MELLKLIIQLHLCNDVDDVVNVSVLVVDTTCSTLPKPVAVPLLVSVAPLGMVMVSPLAPKVREVPDCGSIASTSILLIYLLNTLKNMEQ
jgi:hypothetical protein